jgi:hypothetical protein
MRKRKAVLISWMHNKDTSETLAWHRTYMKLKIEVKNTSTDEASLRHQLQFALLAERQNLIFTLR